MILSQMLSKYTIKSEDDTYNALREIMQEIALAGLYRGGFFEKAAFYGGTALRIFYGLDRFSEDLDFSLLRADEEFSFEPYLAAIKDEFEALGINVTLSAKDKKIQTNIESAFLKNDSFISVLTIDGSGTELKTSRAIKIKFEVDTKPPLRFETEAKLLMLPFSFYVNCFTVENLFAGKLHALLYRGWKQRVKGRDWYDFEWYIKYGVRANLEHLSARAVQSGDLPPDTLFTKESLISQIKNKIASLDFEMAKADIEKFIPDTKRLDIWSAKYFSELAEMVKV